MEQHYPVNDYKQKRAPQEYEPTNYQDRNAYQKPSIKVQQPEPRQNDYRQPPKQKGNGFE